MFSVHLKSMFKLAKSLCLAAIFLSLPLQAKPVVATYYAADGDTAAIAKLPAEKLTHVLYAFLALCGNCLLYTSPSPRDS